MRVVVDILEEKISAAMRAATGQEDCTALVKPAADAKFGDYQANGVMALAKKLKTNPRQLAERIVGKLEIDDMCEPPEIAGPGFINFRLKGDYLADILLEINADAGRLAVEKAEQGKTVVVDFSCPNIAKQMHVGHLRSTIIGDCVCRMLEFQGHNVIRQNHVGDWGTQFGMLCALLYRRLLAMNAVIENMELVSSEEILGELETFYKEAKKLFDSDKIFANTARAAVVGLQSGEGIWRTYWEIIVKHSKKHYQEIYRKLNVTLKPEDERGESAYNDNLPAVVDELKKAGLAEESEGAVCVFPAGFTNKEGEKLPFIVQKSDGAYLYATTDLAALRYRIKELKADHIIYVTDARQKLHFEMLFAAAKMAGWITEDIKVEHVMFGSVLGQDGAPLKTREGETVKLKVLLDEAIERARAVVEEKNPELGENKKAVIAKAVGIGAVKYADYSNNRTSDYIFSFDKMLAMEGNTAPYMQYAYARIKSIERKAIEKDVDREKELAQIKGLDLSEAAELDLAKQLIRYGEAIADAAAGCRPNYLTAYLYDLAQKFSTFYNCCPVLGAAESKRPTRLLLCELTARTIRHGLSELLGIEVVEQM
jgi:arginyl-tRNA synthetase